MVEDCLQCLSALTDPLLHLAGLFVGLYLTLRVARLLARFIREIGK